MAEPRQTEGHALWSSPASFVLVAAGASISMADIWRLPVMMERYGGGAFLLTYILALVFMVLPVLIAELLLGRHVRADIVSVFRKWAVDNRQRRFWVITGYLALLGAFIVLSYSNVFAGWGLRYSLHSVAGALHGLDSAQLRQSFLALVANPELGLGWYTIFVVGIVICSARGLQRGLEPVGRVLVLLAFALLLALLFAAVGVGDLSAAVAQLLHPDFSALGWRGVVEALFQAFFSLGLGVGVMIAFGSYLRVETSLLRVGIAVVVLDIVFSLLAGFVVLLLMHGADMQMATGLRLVFEVFPAAALTLGQSWIVPVFFLMIVCISVTTALGLMEPVAVWIMHRYQLTRVRAVAVTGLAVWFFGLGTLLSFNVLSSETLYQRTVFEWLELVSARVLLPLVGLLVCLFVGRFLPQDSTRTAWGINGHISLAAWRWCLRYPARIGLVLVILYSLGVVAFFEPG